MQLLPKWILTNTMPSLYDAEAGSASAMAKAAYEAVNGIITEYNDFVDSANKKIEEFTGTTREEYQLFAVSLRQEFQDFIDVISLRYKEQNAIIKSFEDGIDGRFTAVDAAINAVEETIAGKFAELDSIIANISDTVRETAEVEIAKAINSGSLQSADNEARAAIAEAEDNITNLQDGLNSHKTDTNNPHSVTLEQIGAAPAGFGLGVTPTKVTAAGINTAKNNGWYKVEGAALTVGGYTDTNWIIHVVKHSDSDIAQHMYPQSDVSLHAVRRCFNGAWAEEWENPPAEPGVEYRLTKRYNGGILYRKLVEMGTLPKKSDKEVVHNETAVGQIVSARYYGKHKTSSNTSVFPYITAAGTTGVTVLATATRFMIHSFIEGSADYNGYAEIEYTRE